LRPVLKYSVTILLILLIALQTFSKWCLIMEYQANRDYIARTLCVNRSKPACCCHGKCYLGKKLAADESGQQAPGKGGQKEESPLQVLAWQNILPDRLPPLLISVNPIRYLISFPQEAVHGIFRPPQA
jgi:hypothetical protein